MKALASTIFLTACLAGAAEPSAPDGMLLAAKVAIRQNEFSAAFVLLEKAIALEPDRADLHYWLGSAYRAAGQTAGPLAAATVAKNVKTEMERAVKLDPNFIEARVSLVTFYTQTPKFLGGNEARALALAEEAARLDAVQGHRAYAAYYASRRR